MRPATDKQLAYLRSLTERVHGDQAEAALRELDNNAAPTLTSADASQRIDAALKALATAPRPRSSSPQLGPGVYRHNGGVYRVFPAQGSGRLIAKLYVDGSWEYAGAAHRLLRAEERMSLEDVKAFGVDTGMCGICGRTLTNPESVAAGIGPVCASKF